MHVAMHTCQYHDSTIARMAVICGAVGQVVHALTLREVESVIEQPTVIAVAAFFGKVRLIDNLEVAC